MSAYIHPESGNPIPFTAGEHWPAPDMTLLKPERPPAPVLSDVEFQKIFGPWSDWLKDAAEVKGAPVDYVALGLLSVASAVIGNSRWATPWEGWKEAPILWGILVGDPSAGKSPALDAILDPVKEIEQGMSEDYRQARRDWEAKAELAALSLADWKASAKRAISEGEEAPDKPESAEAGPPPIRDRIRISDTTTEKVAELLAASWRGLLLFRDELSGWLGGMDRYNGGGDRPFWLETYGGRSYTVDRKSNPEPIIVDHLSVSILGGTQPDKLKSLLQKVDDDGMLARFLTVFPEPVPLSRPRARLDAERLGRGLRALQGLTPMRDETGNLRPSYIPFTDQAANALQAFRGECRTWEAGAAPLMKSHVGKLPGMAVRVACVLAHLDWAAHPETGYPDKIEIGHIGRACHLVGEHYRRHAYRAYGAADVPEDVANARRIADLVDKEKSRRLVARDIQRRELSGLQTAKALDAAFRVLEQADWVRRETEATGGRPRVAYIVNPKLREQS
ncbi:YfjI family protein [uncultured Celeribacter sp.]|uniref:YfjI family protein n=1 Tax=uncultured Celeribacter sp. TaxID=1303376 RepID=UPI002AA94C9E|nr:YfjI family protein [uncultured Celeribacter sp.]